jgi:hypothetical protein
MSALIVERFFANRDPDRIAQQMSPLGHQRHFEGEPVTSALP